MDVAVVVESGARRPERLPEGYYLENLEQVVQHALQRDRALFTVDEGDVLQGFLALPLGARRLYARLYSRQGAIFRRSLLQYPEVGDLDAALASLEAAGLVMRRLLPRNPDEMRDELQLFTVDELRRAVRDAGLRVATRKEELVAEVRASRAAADIVRGWDTFVVQERAEVFDVAQLVFFGNLGQDLSEFVLVSLERARYPAYALTRELPLFPSRAALDAYLDAVTFEYAAPPATHPALLLHRTGAALAALTTSAPLPSHAWRLDPRRCYARVALAGARELEQQELADDALDAYAALVRHAPQPRVRAEAADRLGLLAARRGAPERFTTVCAALLADPTLDGVARFAVETRAARLRGRGRGRHLREPPIVELTLVGAGRGGSKALYRNRAGQAVTIEEATLEVLGGGLLAENALYRTLFGLLLWDVIYAPVPGVFQHRFQTAPLDLASEQFFPNRVALITARFAALAQADLVGELRAAWHAHHGTLNATVAWDLYPLIDLERAVAALGHGLLPLLERLARHPRRHGRGLPDLLVLGSDGPLLVEVKGPGDAPLLEQRLWHDALLEMGLPVRIARVRREDAQSVSVSSDSAS